MEEKQLTDIEKLRYIHTFLETGEGDKNLAMDYAIKLGDGLDDFQAKLCAVRQCGKFPTIPGP